METSSWRFPGAFWTANLIELCERAAYYGWFIMLAVFLTDVVHYTDIQAHWIGGIFAALLYLLPFLTGAFADRVGFRRALLLALLLLTLGYSGLGLLPRQHYVLLSMLFIMVGGALVKPIITGTVARSSDTENRARAFSLFYMMVNIGSFFGKTIAKPLRVNAGLAFVPYCSAAVMAGALVIVALFYFPKVLPEETAAQKMTVGEALRKFLSDFSQVLRSGRLMALVLITAGFWIIQTQLYSSMPIYVLRLVGNDASPEWYANINPVMVTLLVVPITYLARRMSPMASIALSMALIPLSSLAIAWLPQLIGPVSVPTLLRIGPLSGAGALLHPVTVAMGIGIALQGLAECFLSPRYLEYASRQAPPGKEALYMGYAHLNNFFAWLIGYVLSGYLINAFCPDPTRLPPAERLAHAAAMHGQGPLPAAYAHAHYLWFVFASIGGLAFVLLLGFQFLARRREEST